MIVHPKRRTMQQVQVPLTSLIDMVFLLLIYFLLTANFLVEEGISIKLPRADAGEPQVEEVLTIDVDREGKAFIGDQEFPADRLLSKLQDLLHIQPNKVVVVKADRTVELDKAVKILDLAKTAGAQRLSLATEKDF